MNKGRLWALALAFFLAGTLSSSCAQAGRFSPVSVEMLAGTGRANLDGSQPEYRGGFVAAAFTFPAGSLSRQATLTWQIEPSVGWGSDAASSVEAAVGFFLRYGRKAGMVRPYLKVGTGPYYMSRTTTEQPTRFNIASSAAAGVCVGQFVAECRWRHVSNAGISDPNGGINTVLFLIGYSHRF